MYVCVWGGPVGWTYPDDGPVPEKTTRAGDDMAAVADAACHAARQEAAHTWQRQDPPPPSAALRPSPPCVQAADGQAVAVPCQHHGPAVRLLHDRRVDGAAGATCARAWVRGGGGGQRGRAMSAGGRGRDTWRQSAGGRQQQLLQLNRSERRIPLAEPVCHRGARARQLHAGRPPEAPTRPAPSPRGVPRPLLLVLSCEWRTARPACPTSWLWSTGRSRCWACRCGECRRPRR